MARPINPRGEFMPTRALTERQLEALKLRAMGLSVDEAAVRVGIHRSPFMKRIQGAYRKLGVEALVDALRALGWLRVPK